MNFYSGILGTVFLLGVIVMAYCFTKKGNYSGFRLKSLGYIAIVIGVLAINAILVVVAPRVPYQLKDGTFGGAGGILFGSCIVNVVLGVILLGMVSKKLNAEGVVTQLPIPEEKNRYPAWFNNSAHSTLGTIAGISIGWLLVAVFKHQGFSESIPRIGVLSIIFSGIYLVVLVGFSIYRKISGTTIA